MLMVLIERWTALGAKPAMRPLCPLVPERDLEHGLVVRQHTDDHLATKQVGEIGGRFEPERQQRAHLLRAPHAGDHPVAGGGQVLGHGRAHPAKSNKSNLTRHGGAAVSCCAWLA
ncbi:MAG TPA: hypothetical protein VE801_07175 [Xanthobacteraceae bacterium]|nr:hypothetical protein [Xanthobacteraceae bacterium]